MSFHLSSSEIKKLPKNVQDQIAKAKHRYSHIKAGVREDIGPMRFRSKMEANYARYLKWLKDSGLIKDWKFESKTFWFESIKRGTRSYLPDFEVEYANGKIEYHEIKGYMDNKSKTKLKRMKKYYPDVDLILIDTEKYKRIVKDLGKIIKGWEL